MTETPALAHLVGGYFHQDWAYEFSNDEWDAVEAFISSSSLALQLRGEIERLFDEDPSEEALEAHLDGLGCDFTSQDEYGGYGGWLAEVARRVGEATGT